MQPLSLPKTKDYVKFARKASRVAASGPIGLQLGGADDAFSMQAEAKEDIPMPRTAPVAYRLIQAHPETIPIAKNARLVAVPKPNGKARPELYRLITQAFCPWRFAY